jgi:hypothetical protein
VSKLHARAFAKLQRGVSHLSLSPYTPPSPPLVGVELNPGPRGRRGRSQKQPSGVSESSTDSHISTGSDRIIVNPAIDWSGLLSTFPTRLLTRNKYTEIVDIPNGVGASSNYQFRLNSTFDPNLTGTGHQPASRDTLILVYNKYRVHRADWYIEIAPAAAQEFSINPQNHATTYADIGVASEQPRAVARSGSTTTNLVRFRGGAMLHTVNGQTQAQYAANEDCAAAVNSSPTEIIVLNICGQNFASSPAFTGCSAKVTIWYTTEWYDPITVPSS